MNSTRAQLWQDLLHAGLVEGELPAQAHDLNAVQQAWYIRLMLGFAGWVAALFLLGFVGIGWELVFKTAWLALLLGVGVCAIAWKLLNQARQHDFLQQFGIAISFAGQGLVLAGWVKGLNDQVELIAAVMILFELALVMWISNIIHRFLSCLWAVLALAFLLGKYDGLPLLSGVLALLVCIAWWHPKHYQQAVLWRPIAYAMGVALLSAELFFLSDSSLLGHYRHSPLPAEENARVMSVFMLALAALATCVFILKRENLALSQRISIWSLCATALLGLASFWMHGLSAAVLMIVIAFAHGSRLLTGMSVLAMLFFWSHFYHQLRWDLLEKSFILALSAIVLLALRWAVSRFLKETNHG